MHLQNQRNVLFLNDATNQVWFQTEFIDIDAQAPMQVQFDHVLTRLTTGNLDNARVNWSIQLQATSTSPSYTYSQQNSYQVMYGAMGSTTTSTSTSTRTFWWHHGNEEWTPEFIAGRLHVGSSDHNHTIKSEQVTEEGLNEWQSVDTQMTALPFPGSDRARMRVIFWYATGKSNSFKQNQDPVDGITQLVTNLVVKNMYANDVTAPVYERVQEDYTTTLAYEPLFADELPEAVYNRIDQNQFWRVGESAANGRTLERVVTQQKLNDFRTQFQYYEGNLINLNTNPIAPHHKVLLNWGTYQSTAANSTTPVSMIMNGGTFRVKDNSFDAAFYVPDQVGDIASGDGILGDNREITLDMGFSLITLT